jgi:CelD/BcsL family acetyltransferase involved in cellulose biosynthesis
MTVRSACAVKVHDSFDAVSADVWDHAVASGPTDAIFLTWRWQRAWWETYGRGRLLIVVVRRDDESTAIAPFFIDGGMAFLTGSGGDQLYLIGPHDSGTVEATLRALLDEEPGLLGVRLYQVPDHSPTPRLLEGAAAAIGWTVCGEEWLEWPCLEMGPSGVNGRAAADRTSLRRHERALGRQGSLVVETATEPSAIRTQLDPFFEQHVERWAATEFPSLFTDEVSRAFYRNLTDIVGPSGVLRFTTVRLDDESLAFHFGTSYGGHFLWYKPSFAIAHARSSPGEVLLRHLVLRAADEGVSVFDFGIGGEAFKLRFANSLRRVQTWGVYP